MLRATLSVFLFSVAILPGQEKTDDGAPGRVEKRMQAARERALKEGRDLAEILGAKGGKEDLENEEMTRLAEMARVAREGMRGAGSFVRFVPSVKPAKLMPGQSGTLFVTATLSGQAVLEAPLAMERLSGERQGHVTLGAMTVHAAEPGRLAVAYLGRPVYDNYVVLEVPVTMAPDAEVGSRQKVQVEWRFDIHDGASAQLVGKFIDGTAIDIEVGQASDPAVKGAAKATPADAPVATVPLAASPAGPASSVRESSPSVPRVVSGVAPHAVPEESASLANPPAVDSGSDLPPTDSPIGVLPLAVGGGLLLLVIVLLLARKR
ncbi:MAG: hypothetical protein JNK78_15860 [Planctomycetes bacterium]|nr:hypothetical protein [Planctomycetota bacterium]